MSDTVRDAILERLTAAPLKVFSSPPGASEKYPYVVVYFDSGMRSSDRVSDARVSREHGWQTTVVGVNADQVVAALDRVTAALEDWRPTVTGRSCQKVTHDGSQPTRHDETLPDRTLFIATDQWLVTSDPA